MDRSALKQEASLQEKHRDPGTRDATETKIPDARKKKKEDARTGVSAASARAVAARAVAFYLLVLRIPNV